MTNRSIGRIIGALYLAAFGCYGLGASLVTTVTDDPDLLASVREHHVLLSAGAVLMLLNSLVVAGHGVLMHGVLAVRRPTTAISYLVARIFEATVLATGATCLLVLIPLADSATSAAAESVAGVLVNLNEHSYQVAMAGLGIGSAVLFGALLVDAMLPRWLAIWGVVAYAVFAAGAMLELLGIPAGLPATIPAGVFEAAVAIFLLARGLPEWSPADVVDPRLPSPVSVPDGVVR
ncbi:MAG: DUF4386 domain-containing protein [Nocardioides sp.]